MKAVQETLKRDRISLIHDCHRHALAGDTVIILLSHCVCFRSLFDLHMTGLSVSQVLGNSRLTAMHSLHVLRCLQLITPTDMPKIATAAVLYATAMKDIGSIPSCCSLA